MTEKVIAYGREPAVAAAHGDGLWIDIANLPHATGWQLKPEGMCRGEVCVPIPPTRAGEFVHDGRFNLLTFAGHLGQPVVHEPVALAWVIGEAPEERASRLRGLAPDFELPDLSQTMHRLSDQRGRKVLLVTWASW